MLRLAPGYLAAQYPKRLRRGYVPHDHGHAGLTATGQHRGRLGIVLGVTSLIMVAEVVGGLFAHSLALVADAGHMATDVAGIGLSLIGIWFAGRPSTASRTFGFQRVEIFAAVVNAVLLLAVGIFILVEAVLRLIHPEVAVPGLMAIFALLALVGNGVSFFILRPGAGESLNVRGASLEVLSDLFGAFAVLVAAGVIAVWGFQRADAIASMLIGALILPRTLKLLADTVDVLLESAPKDVDLAQVRQHICSTPGVLGVHDLHVWTITSGAPVLSAHVVVDQATLLDDGAAKILDALGVCLAGHFDVQHCTFQLEPPAHQDHELGAHP